MASLALLAGATAQADIVDGFAFNIDPVRNSPDATEPTINDFITQNPDSALEATDDFFNLVGGGNFTNIPANLSGGNSVDIGTFNVTYDADGGSDGNVGFNAGSNAHNDLNPITEGYATNADGIFTITGLLANSNEGDTIVLAVYGIGDNFGQQTTFEAAYGGNTAAEGNTQSTLFNGNGIDGAVVARTSDVGSVPFVNFTFVADGVTDAISFDAIAGSTVNGFSVGVAPVPEPASMSLVGLGALALIARRRKS